MLYWILQTAFLSIIVIFIIHHLVIYFQDNYTIKKTKDLTEIQTQKYKTILDEMRKINEKEKSELIQKLSEPTLSQNDLINMDSDLNDFIQSISE
jgi:ClpP class serine protease